MILALQFGCTAMHDESDGLSLNVKTSLLLIILVEAYLG